MPRHAICGFGPSACTQTGTAVRVLAYGASNTAGYPDYDEPYVKSLVAKCGINGIPLEVLSCGLVGLTARQMVEQLEARGIDDLVGRTGVGLLKLLQDESQDEGPFTFAMLMAGTNDISEGERNAEEICADLVSLHEACHSRGVSTLALSIPDFWRQCPDPRRHAWTEVNESLKQWALSAGSSLVHFVDTAELLPYSEAAVEEGLWEEDGIHFSTEGSRHFGNALAETLRPLLNSSLSQVSGTVDNRAPEPIPGRIAEVNASKLLILGSSSPVRTIDSSKSLLARCAEQLERTAKEMDINAQSIFLEGGNLQTWQAWLCNATHDVFSHVRVVLFTLVLDNEELPCLDDDTALDEFVETFCEALQLFVFVLRGNMPEDARLCVGGPYAETLASELQQSFFEKLQGRMASFLEVDERINLPSFTAQASATCGGSTCTEPLTYDDVSRVFGTSP
eukprot:TRINITY_DN97633_c0_g1_i1.p1 TRINITY_DN97633_c0_g1~~TRINITY_DN97633_c0_g1_i1.p1  ORF type:complete len:451 (-),score=54.86 TRINITY_DN97633_c0_g1_i1:56-1408(-)